MRQRRCAAEHPLATIKRDGRLPLPHQRHNQGQSRNRSQPPGLKHSARNQSHWSARSEQDSVDDPIKRGPNSPLEPLLFARPAKPPPCLVMQSPYADSVSSLFKAMGRHIVARSEYSRLSFESSCRSAICAHSVARFRHSSANTVLIGKICAFGKSGALSRCVHLHCSICACDQAS